MNGILQAHNRFPLGAASAYETCCTCSGVQLIQLIVFIDYMLPDLLCCWTPGPLAACCTIVCLLIQQKVMWLSNSPNYM